MKGPPVEILAAAGVVMALGSAILPTCLYLYVEPRGRIHWAEAGDTPMSRRAPAIVRVAAWSSFAVAQLALVSALVPIACGILLYLQAKLGAMRSGGFFVTAATLGLSVGQIVASLRLLPFGVHLLVRNARTCARARSLARGHALVSAAILASAGSFAGLMASLPRWIHPWLRTALEWSALWPLLAYAAVCLGHALLLGQCVPRLEPQPSRARVARGDFND